MIRSYQYFTMNKGSSSRNSSSSSTSHFQFLLCTGVLLLVLSSSNLLLPVWGCNEAVCASIVSKCTLTQACKCTLKNCTCCRECFDCLTYLYDECCSCVELCPKPNVTASAMMHSQVGDLKEPMPDLFNILTEEKDLQGRWATFTYPIDIDQSWFQPKVDTPPSKDVVSLAGGKIVVDPSKEVITVNCTVAYMSQCMPLNKCKNSCHSMGASYFRWFHDGCCQCIGRTCINYGIDESRCSSCSLGDDLEEDVEEVDEASNSNIDGVGVGAGVGVAAGVGETVTAGGGISVPSTPVTSTTP